MDTIEWGNTDYDDYDFEDIDSHHNNDHSMYSEPNSSTAFHESSFYEDFTGSLIDPFANFFANPTVQIKPEPAHPEPTPNPVFSIPPTLLQPQVQPTFVKSETKAKQTTSHKRQLCEVSRSLGNELDIKIETQPPVEVRTRTPSEVRTFSVTCKLSGNYKQHDASIMKVQLSYAPTPSQALEQVKKDIMGGTKTVAVTADGTAVFDNLWISESSTKHKEREFCLEFILLSSDGTELLRKYSRPFYAYSHKKVLQRRGNVKLRTISKSYGKISGGEQMHVIGTPFIQGPALSLVFRTPHGDVPVNNLEFYSDSVLFFDLPQYPLPEGLSISPDTEFKATVLLTNDGRTYSNPIDFTYVSDSVTPRSRI